MSAGEKYEKLVIRDAMVVNGKGTPPYGPCDIIIQDGIITDIINVDTISLNRYRKNMERPKGDHIINAKGKFVIPGLVDMHVHIIKDEKCGPRGAEYAYKLNLAHGVTTIRTCGFGTDKELLKDKKLSEENKITAPHIKVLGSWPSEAKTVEESREKVREMKELGVDGVKMIPRPHVTPEMLEAITDELKKHDLPMIAIHHPQSSDLNALISSNAAKEKLTIEHTYGIPQAAIPGTQTFPPGYNYSNEVDRFRMSGHIWTEADKYPDRVRGVFDRLLENKTIWDPTMVVYEAHRDYERAKALPWHKQYTVRQLWEAYSPSPGRHATHFFEWKTSDEIAWKKKYWVWMKWVKYFFDRGGILVAGSDTAFIYALFGFALIRELELFQEAGIHPIDVIKIASTNAHLAMGDEARANGLRVDSPADLAIIDGNPLDNFKVMYGTGVKLYAEDGTTVTSGGGVAWTIKDGIVFDCKALLKDVEEYVDSQR